MKWVVAQIYKASKLAFYNANLSPTITPKLTTAFKYLIHKQHILRLQSYLCTGKCNSTVMVVITILNEKVRLTFVR